MLTNANAMSKSSPPNFPIRSLATTLNPSITIAIAVRTQTSRRIWVLELDEGDMLERDMLSPWNRVNYVNIEK